MRTKLIFYILKYCICFICLMFGMEINAFSQTNSMIYSIPFQPQLFFDTTNDIKMFFDKNDIPSDGKLIESKTKKYYFILAKPYSGVDTTDLYCYVRRGDRWVLFLNAFLWKTPFKEDIDFKVEGDFVNVICKGVTILKLDTPK